MPRPELVPPCPGLPLVRAAGCATRDYAIRLITPMFGGGVEAGEPDASFPIRGTSIRGQLQFWWRATRGSALGTTDELFHRHAEIWGTTEKASPVGVEVRAVRTAAPRPCARYGWDPQAGRGQGGWRLYWEEPFRNSALPYALFPFQGEAPSPPRPDVKPKKEPSSFIGGGSFSLRVRFPESLRVEVERAVWAWVNFGGLGARTRRGCGSLCCPDLSPTDFDHLETWFRAGVQATAAVQREWSIVPLAFLTHGGVSSPIGIWDDLIGFLKYFRQGEEFARNRGQKPNRPGRSRFPEPESIRSVTKPPSSVHARLPHIPDDAFPRAEFGLPIGFHFQPGQGDPPDTFLYPTDGPDGKRRDRMASPLILKPLALADGKQAVPLIMRLVTDPLEGVDLRRGDSSLALPPGTAVRGARLATYANSPLAAAPNGSALDAFLALARDARNGFQEVSL
jgi:CRISPR-associated protein Cmr1